MWLICRDVNSVMKNTTVKTVCKHTCLIFMNLKSDICNIKFLIADKMMDEHKDKVHGIKTKTIKQFGGMRIMMVSD